MRFFGERFGRTFGFLLVGLFLFLRRLLFYCRRFFLYRFLHDWWCLFALHNQFRKSWWYLAASFVVYFFDGDQGDEQAQSKNE